MQILTWLVWAIACLAYWSLTGSTAGSDPSASQLPKDGVEKRFCVSKSQLKVSPVYLHKDEHIEAMLLLNMLALLAYSVLERQTRQHGLQMTTRRIIEKLQTLDVVETNCWDGSRLLRRNPVDEEQAMLLNVLARVLVDFQIPRWPYPLLPVGTDRLMALLPPGRDASVV